MNASMSPSVTDELRMRSRAFPTRSERAVLRPASFLSVTRQTHLRPVHHQQELSYPPHHQGPPATKKRLLTKRRL